MNQQSRTVNSLRSASTGALGQAVTFLLQFVSRTIFIYTIGKEYLGISGLFTSVLTILNISELGVGAAIVYNLYKPLADGDEAKVRANMNLLKNAYRLVGLAVLVLGVLLYPFLPYLMKGTTDLVNVNLIYALYVLNSVVSYWFFAYKSAVLLADQKRYVVNIIGCSVAICTVLVQIFILAFMGSFVGYVVAQIIGSIAKSLCTSIYVRRHYRFLSVRDNARLPREEKRKIFKNLLALVTTKISSTLLSSTDNLIISGAIGTVVVGLYSNYYLIMNSLQQLIHNAFSSFTASLGNLYIREGREKNEFIFRCLSFLNFWIYGFCSICLWNLFNPFIGMIWGRDMLFGELTVMIIVLNFLTDGLQSSVITFRDACGLFWQGRYMPLIGTGVNLAVSVLLVKPLGVAGVFLGTIISRFTTTWWYNALLIYRRAFDKSSVRYFIRFVMYLLITCIVGEAIYLATAPLAVYGDICLFAVRCAVCITVPNIVFFLLFRRSEEFKYLLTSAKPIIGKLLKRKAK